VLPALPIRGTIQRPLEENEDVAFVLGWVLIIALVVRFGLAGLGVWPLE